MRRIHSSLFKIKVTSPDRLWFDCCLALVGAAMLLLLTMERAAFLQLFRLVLGAAYVLFVPGYFLTAALFPRKTDLDNTERWALSFGLSAAVVSLLALLLDHLPWGIQFVSILISEYTVTAIFMTLALWRRFWLPIGLIYVPALPCYPRSWWYSLTLSERRVYGLLVGVVLLGLLSAAWIFAVPSPREFLTEFYILGRSGRAEDYPRNVTPDDLVYVNVGVVSLEESKRNYHLEIWASDPWDPNHRTLVDQEKPFSLDPQQKREWTVTWHMPWIGNDQQVEFLLFSDDSPQPYRQLRLWLNVVESPPAG